MLKILAMAALMVIGNCWASDFTCFECGGECAPACGTRRFRTCCFNYLRRKRVPEMVQLEVPNNYIHDEDEQLGSPYPTTEGQELWWTSILSGGSYGSDDE